MWTKRKSVKCVLFAFISSYTYYDTTNLFYIISTLFLFCFLSLVYLNLVFVKVRENIITVCTFVYMLLRSQSLP